METYKTAASQGFTKLVEQYTTKEPIFEKNIWFAGNTLHTCLGYLNLAHETDIKYQILPTAFGIYQYLKDKADWWRDDYAWWGNAFAVAINNRNGLGYGDPKFDSLFNGLLDAVKECCAKLNDNWDDSPYDSTPMK
jgi:hypothetical protein